MIKDIVVNLEHRGARDPARDFAISVAEAFDAHVTGVAFAYVPTVPGFIMPGIPSDVLAQVLANNEKSASAAIEGFEAAAKRSLVSMEHRLFETTEANAPLILARFARRFDLSVFTQSEPKVMNNDDMIETSLFESGRPIIIVPYIQRDGLKLDRVVCCWDGSRAAARSINDALPLLVKAKSVDLLIVLNEKTRGDQKEIRGTEIGRHLARHGVEVQIQTTWAVDIDVANAILSYAADQSATLMVMGGYGHAKMREVVLGGVTRDMLKSMTVPVFMSH